MSTVRKGKGKRYAAQERANIINFINQHDSINGRGGKSAAAKKFGVTPLTLGNWMRSAGGLKGKIAKGKGFLSTREKTSSKNGSHDISVKITEMISLAGQIDKAEADLAKLRARFQNLKSGL